VNVQSYVKYIIIILFSCFLIQATPLEDHDIHISICEFDFRKSTPKLTIKTFLDDLQAAVGLEPGADLPAGYTSSDELITNYLQESILLSVDGGSIDYKVMSIDASTDAVWITCELTTDLSLSQIQIQNTFLTEVYDDQTNLIKVISAAGRKTMSMDGDETEIVVEVE